MVQGFGRGGIVDSEGRRGHQHRTADRSGDAARSALHATPTVVKDIVIVGSSFREGLAVKSRNNTKGLVRAFDVRTGQKALAVQHDSAARRVRQRHLGERLVGHDRQRRRVDADHRRRRCGTRLSAGRVADLRPLRRPSAGQQPVRRDAGRGRSQDRSVRKWHFQFVHHPIWDHDMSSAPLLADIVVNGKPIKAVAVPEQAKLPLRIRSDHGAAGLADSGSAGATVDGSRREDIADAAHSRPSLPLTRAFVKVPDDIIDFTPELRQSGLEQLKRLAYNPSPHNPPVVSKPEGPLAALTIGTLTGGTNWPRRYIRSRAAHGVCAGLQLVSFESGARGSAKGSVGHRLHHGYRGFTPGADPRRR